MTPPYLTPLFSDALRTIGIPEPWNIGRASRVRFHEIDALGHVNNAAYLSWFEDFRIFYLGHMQVTDYGPTAPRLVVAEVGCIFREELLLRHDYVVTGRTRTLGTSSFTMDYAVWKLGSDRPTLATEGHAVVVLRTRDGTGKYPVPNEARGRLIIDGAIEK